MPFFFTLRFFRLFRRLFPAAAPADPGGLRGALRLRCRLRPLEDLLKVVVQGVALDGAVFLHQGVAQLPPVSGPPHKRQAQALLDGWSQGHLPEGGAVPGPQGFDGGLVPLVLADDVGVIRLALTHQHAQLRDDLEVDGVFAAPDALDILHFRLGVGAQLLQPAESQAGLLIKYQDGVLLGEHIDALQPGADVVVAVHQKYRLHENSSFFFEFLPVSKEKALVVYQISSACARQKREDRGAVLPEW